MSTIQIALGLLAVLLLAWWWSRRRAAPSAKVADRIDTVTGWPPQATRVLSAHERLAYSALARALPEYMILAQVPLARFIKVPKRNSYADWLRRIGSQCADFVVCDGAAQVVAVIEVEPAQPSERARKRLDRMERTLKAAKIPMQTWSENALPPVDAVRAAVLPATAEGVVAAAPAMPAAVEAPAVAAAALPRASGAEPPPPAKPNPFDDADRDSTHDEWIELLEPPPTTWYDDLDSGSTPLRKN